MQADSQPIDTIGTTVACSHSPYLIPLLARVAEDGIHEAGDGGAVGTREGHSSRVRQRQTDTLDAPCRGAVDPGQRDPLFVPGRNATGLGRGPTGQLRLP